MQDPIDRLKHMAAEGVTRVFGGKGVFQRESLRRTLPALALAALATTALAGSHEAAAASPGVDASHVAASEADNRGGDVAPPKGLVIAGDGSAGPAFHDLQPFDRHAMERSMAHAAWFFEPENARELFRGLVREGHFEDTPDAEFEGEIRYLSAYAAVSTGFAEAADRYGADVAAQRLAAWQNEIAPHLASMDDAAREGTFYRALEDVLASAPANPEPLEAGESRRDQVIEAIIESPPKPGEAQAIGGPTPGASDLLSGTRAQGQGYSDFLKSRAPAPASPVDQVEMRNDPLDF